MTTLFVSALAEEVAALPSTAEVLELGVGKVSAATRLAGHLRERPDVDLVVNVGTAGGLRGQAMGTVVEVGRVVQHDLDVDGISHLVGRTMPGGPLDLGRAGVTLATGDRFVTDRAVRASLATRADLVDMEGYAVVAACHALDIAVRVVKCVSDGADGDAAMTWQLAMDHCARALAIHLVDTGLLRAR